MIRGLREDGSCLPVAFLDAQCYMASLKTFGSTKLWIAADAWKGLWFGGFGVSCFGQRFSSSKYSPDNLTGGTLQDLPLWKITVANGSRTSRLSPI